MANYHPLVPGRYHIDYVGAGDARHVVQTAGVPANTDLVWVRAANDPPADRIWVLSYYGAGYRIQKEGGNGGSAQVPRPAKDAIVTTTGDRFEWLIQPDGNNYRILVPTAGNLYWTVFDNHNERIIRLQERNLVGQTFTINPVA